MHGDMNVKLRLYVNVCQGMTAPVHSIRYSIQRLLQIMCTNCKKILSSPLLREMRTTDVSTRTSLFPLPLIRLPNYVLVCSQTLSHFLQHYRLNATKHKLREIRLRWSVLYTQWCAGWATDSGHSPAATLNDWWQHYSKVDPCPKWGFSILQARVKWRVLGKLLNIHTCMTDGSIVWLL